MPTLHWNCYINDEISLLGFHETLFFRANVDNGAKKSRLACATVAPFPVSIRTFLVLEARGVDMNLQFLVDF